MRTWIDHVLLACALELLKSRTVSLSDLDMVSADASRDRFPLDVLAWFGLRFSRLLVSFEIVPKGRTVTPFVFIMSVRVMPMSELSHRVAPLIFQMSLSVEPVNECLMWIIPSVSSQSNLFIVFRGMG